MTTKADPGNGQTSTPHRQKTVAEIIAEVAKQLGVPPAVALAMGEQESGLRPNAVGDGGTSFGIFQLHEGGELGSHTKAWAENVRHNAETALRVVAEVHAKNPGADWGWITAHAQRPADEAGYAASVNSILAGYHNSGEADPTAYFEKNARAGATLATDQGGGGGASPSQNVSNADIKRGLNAMGFASQLIHSNASLNNAFQTIVNKQLDLSSSGGRAEALSILQNTNWFQNHTKAQRQFDELRYSDPATWQRDLNQQRHALAQQATQMGVDINHGELDHLATMTLRNGLSSQEISSALSKQFDFNANGSYDGTAGQTIDSIRQQAASYYAPVSDQQIQHYTRQVLAGSLDPSSLGDIFKQQALSMYPYLKQQLDNGQTVQQIADPYKQLMASTLELDPSAIKQNDRSIMQALQSKDEQGNLGLMPLWQFQNKLYDDPRWLQTNNAHESLVGTAGTVLQKMGLIT